MICFDCSTSPLLSEWVASSLNAKRSDMGNAFRENLLTKKDPDGFLRRGLCDCCSAEMNHTFHFLLNSSVEWIDDTISLNILSEDKEVSSPTSSGKVSSLNLIDNCVVMLGLVMILSCFLLLLNPLSLRYRLKVAILTL